MVMPKKTTKRKATSDIPAQENFEDFKAAFTKEIPAVDTEALVEEVPEKTAPEKKDKDNLWSKKSEGPYLHILNVLKTISTCLPWMGMNPAYVFLVVPSEDGNPAKIMFQNGQVFDLVKLSVSVMKIFGWDTINSFLEFTGTKGPLTFDQYKEMKKECVFVDMINDLVEGDDEPFCDDTAYNTIVGYMNDLQAKVEESGTEKEKEALVRLKEKGYYFGETLKKIESLEDLTIDNSKLASLPPPKKKSKGKPKTDSLSSLDLNRVGEVSLKLWRQSYLEIFKKESADENYLKAVIVVSSQMETLSKECPESVIVNYKSYYKNNQEKFKDFKEYYKYPITGDLINNVSFFEAIVPVLFYWNERRELDEPCPKVVDEVCTNPILVEFFRNVKEIYQVE